MGHSHHRLNGLRQDAKSQMRIFGEVLFFCGSRKRKIESSHLFVNGVEPKDWSFVIGNGLRNSYFKALPPGQILSFGYQLGPRYFSTPGIYSVRWEGPTYKSAEVTFRVMPGGR